VLGWNLQGRRQRNRPKRIWRRTIQEEFKEIMETLREIKQLSMSRV
jgi:hypothetical protein